MFEIVFDPASLRRRGETAHATIFFLIDGRAWPAAGWDDFVVIVLNGWMEAATRLARDFSSHETLEFMDGECAVQFFKQSSGFEVRWKPHQSRPSHQVIGQISSEVLWHTLLRTGDVVVEACRTNGWHDRDLDQLADRIEILRECTA